MHTPPSIEIVVRGVCRSSDRTRILVCRNVARGNRYLPGGHVEWGESSPAALVREWREELGTDCTPGRFLGIVEQRYGDTCEIGLYFLCSSPSLESSPALPLSAEPHIAFEWIPLEALPSAGLFPGPLLDLLPAWLSSSPPPASIHTISNLP